MKCNQWTLALIGAGLVSLPAVTQAEEKPSASVLTALSPTTISGYVDTSAQWNFGTGNANLPPYAFGGASKADGFNLNVVKISLEKPVDNGEGWAAGYKVDLLAGPDANAFATQSFFGNGGKAGAGDFGVKQAYVALHAPVGNGLDFKVGVFDTIIGYEVFESGNNPNFTRSYGYSLEPTTHTGILATYQVCDAVSVSGGVADTFGPIINERAQGPNATFGGVTKAESYKTYMGSLTLTAPKDMGFLSGSTLTACVINGFNSAFADNETSYYAGLTMNTPLSCLKVGLAFDDLDIAQASGENWVVGGYALVQATEKLSINVRGEYMKDRGAQKAFQTMVTDPTGTVVPVATAPDEVLGVTATAQYDLWKNVISRLELRWDHSLSGGDVWGGTTPNSVFVASGAGSPGNQKNSWMLAANIIYKF